MVLTRCRVSSATPKLLPQTRYDFNSETDFSSSVEPTSLISILHDVVIIEAGIKFFLLDRIVFWHKAVRGTSRSSSERAEPSEHALSQRPYKVFATARLSKRFADTK